MPVALGVEPAAPFVYQTCLHPLSDFLLEKLASCGEELRSVVKPSGADSTGGHPSAG
jgi:hypothetical protein